MAASRIQRWAIQLSGYQFDIKYRSTDKNGNADALSRLPMKTMDNYTSNSLFYNEANSVNKMQIHNLPVTAKKIAQASKNDQTLSRVTHFVLNGWPEKNECPEKTLPYFNIKDELTVEEGCLLRGIRVIIPERHQSEILTDLHTNHPGIVRMKALARLHIWWPGMDSDIEMKVRKCQMCQEQQPNLPKAQANPWLWPTRPWQRVHVDFTGPFMNKCS